MTEPSTDMRIDLWRLAYSRAAFLQAKGIAQVLRKCQSSITFYHRIGLLTGLVVTYIRPFSTTQVTKSKRIVPMHDITVPPEHKDLHGTYNMIRHQVLGHKDATGPTTADGILNEVHFLLDDECMNVHTVTPHHFDPKQLNETLILCDKLISLLDTRLNMIVENQPFPRLEKGQLYALNIEDQFKPWIVRKNQ